MDKNKIRWFSFLAAFMLMLTVLPAGSTSYAQGNSRTFPETGKTVSGKFLDYWNNHGGLAQQGYPITDERPEVSDTDGKTYSMQYFERAIFEQHPENPPPFDVLLSLLGVFLYQQKYPGGAPGQLPNNEAGSRLFSETGHRVGGIFLQYWNTHGALPQQGFPISDEFSEVSDLNGQTYKVQYFERAVFEWHPENAPPYNVLLSQLGTFRLRAKSAPTATPTAVPVPPTDTPVPVPPTNTPVPAPTDTPRPTGCDTSGNRNGSATPSDVKVGDVMIVRASGFRPGENVSFWYTTPSGIVVGTPAPVPGGVNPDGTIGPLPLVINSSFVIFGYGRWALTFQGASSGNTAVIYFALTAKG